MQSGTDVMTTGDSLRGGDRVLLSLARRIRHGRLTLTLPDGARYCLEGPLPGPTADLTVRRPRLARRLLLGGDIGFAEAYMDGDCETTDLPALIELAARNQDALGGALGGSAWRRLLLRLGHRLRPNTRHGARRNIAYHYDLGNEFYSKWLDPDLTYSSAIFDHPGQGLAEAQTSKYRRIAATADVRSGHRVLEIGCGWGGFATFAASEIGCQVAAITISDEQYAFAARRVQEAGLSDRVEVLRRDYRDVRGQFDRIVSVEMLEAVGERYWPTFFARMRDNLRSGGRAAIQTIVIADALWARYRRRADFVQRYIFPGGMLPAPSALHREVGRAGLTWHGDIGFGADYARTLAHWRRRFEAAWPEIATLGFDERFRRLWTYYLAYSEVGFRVGRIDVRQIALAKD